MTIFMLAKQPTGFPRSCHWHHWVSSSKTDTQKNPKKQPCRYRCKASITVIQLSKLPMSSHWQKRIKGFVYLSGAEVGVNVALSGTDIGLLTGPRINNFRKVLKFPWMCLQWIHTHSLLNCTHLKERHLWLWCIKTWWAGDGFIT